MKLKIIMGDLEMDIFEKLEELAKKGYSIEHTTVDQYDNGYGKDVEKGLIPPVTYTVNVIRLSDCEILYNLSCNHIKECFDEGIKYVENLIKNGGV
ncbi:MAG: hypothetical protein K0R54_229 [Clostridiaceae bacterium]|jgi:hypothetical protein|nr:hypothetical protein [Clostridiaceae bacterium]